MGERRRVCSMTSRNPPQYTNIMAKDLQQIHRHDTERERRVISTLLNFVRLYPDAAEIISDDNVFYDPQNRDLFRALGDFLDDNKRFDITAFPEYVLGHRKRYPSFKDYGIGDVAAHIMELYSNYTPGDEIKEYFLSRAARIAELYVLREYQDIATKITDVISKDATITPTEIEEIAERFNQVKKVGISEFAPFYEPLTRERMADDLRKQGDGYKTGYIFTPPVKLETTIGAQRDIEQIELIIPPKQVTIVAAGTGHGKSTFLINLALRICLKYPEQKVLYLTYEEARHNVAAKFINTLCGLDLARDNRKEIKKDIELNADKNGGENMGKFILDDDFFNCPDTLKNRKRGIYRNAVKTFFDDLEGTGRLNIQYSEYSTTDLIRLIKNMKRNGRADICFIDYVQMLDKPESVSHGRNRPDELKDICNDLRKLAVDEKDGLSIVFAAQFNRDLINKNDPRLMSETLLGEGANLEHFSNTIIGLWNCAKIRLEGTTQTSKGYLATDDGGRDDKGTDYDPFARNYNKNGVALKKFLGVCNDLDEPFIFARLLKTRDGVGNGRALFNYYGNCGVIANFGDPENPSPTERLTGYYGDNPVRGDAKREPTPVWYPLIEKKDNDLNSQQTNENIPPAPLPELPTGGNQEPANKKKSKNQGVRADESDLNDLYGLTGGNKSNPDLSNATVKTSSNVPPLNRIPLPGGDEPTGDGKPFPETYNTDDLPF